jgi:23S rRNA (cytosine1962-C5)-methyltransferase
MTRPAILRLKKDEDRRIRAGHVWVFSNEIDTRATPLTEIEPGAIVEVQDVRGNFLGRGYANPHSLISARLLTRNSSTRIGPELFRERLRGAQELRDRLFPGEPFYRMAFGEADGLPGIVVDRYGSTLVLQVTTAGMERWVDELVGILGEMVGAEGILLRADSPAREHEQLPLYTRVASGDVPGWVPVRENGVHFEAPVLEGQKTGWFFDHRMNRERLRRHVPGRRVLDVFSYVGGWGVQAASFGADEVLCVDTSAPALEGVDRNAALNQLQDRVSTERGDAFAVLQRLRDVKRRFDVVILDPPAFIKRRKDQKEGEQAYRRLNRLALDLLEPGGMLVSASCSFHLGRDALLRAILWGAAASGREVQVVEEGHQGPDHPFHPAIVETNYLKAFFVRVL